MTKRHVAVGYRVEDGQLLTAPGGVLVRVFRPPWWALHRWVWWGLNVLVDAVWRWLLLAMWKLGLSRGGDGKRRAARMRGRIDVPVKLGQFKGTTLESVRVVQVMRGVKHGNPGSHRVGARR